MLKATLEACLLSEYKIGLDREICVSHLQFDDDIIIIGRKRVGKISEP